MTGKRASGAPTASSTFKCSAREAARSRSSSKAASTVRPGRRETSSLHCSQLHSLALPRRENGAIKMGASSAGAAFFTGNKDGVATSSPCSPPNCR